MGEDKGPDKPEAADMNPRNLPHRPHSTSPCRKLAIVAAAAVLAFAAGTAGAAQYQWRDDKGRMVYSDLPPPASVAPNRIIRAPEVPRAALPTAAPGQDTAVAGQNKAAPAPAGVAPVAAAGAAAPGAGDAKLSNADREMAWRKRLADRAEEEKKAAEASRRKVELARACSDAQGDIRSLESGQRISRINAAGEREFLPDAERAQRLAAARKSVGERC